MGDFTFRALSMFICSRSQAHSLDYLLGRSNMFRRYDRSWKERVKIDLTKRFTAGQELEVTTVPDSVRPYIVRAYSLPGVVVGNQVY